MTSTNGKLGIDQFFFRYHEDLPHQRLAVAELWKLMPVSLLEEDADWIQTFAIQRLMRILRFRLFLLARRTRTLGWCQGRGRKRGRSSQGSSCSGRSNQQGDHVSGEHNYFGIKAAGDEPYSTCTTWEHYDGKDIEIQARFRDFDSLQDCINDLVTKWYLDYKTYKGVNRASSVGECCQLLRQEGYATDPHYASKLMSIINRQAG